MALVRDARTAAQRHESPCRFGPHRHVGLAPSGGSSDGAGRSAPRLRCSRAGRRLPPRHDMRICDGCKRRDVREHCGRMRGGRAAHCELCAAKLRAGGGGAALSAYRGWSCGCEGAISAAPMAEGGFCRTRFATSALRGRSVRQGLLLRPTASLKNAKRLRLCPPNPCITAVRGCRITFMQPEASGSRIKVYPAASCTGGSPSTWRRKESSRAGR